MNNRFRIEFRKVNGDLHVNPKGDFDGNSAWELINLLQKKYNGEGQVFIDTRGLRRICPFGSATFRYHVHQIRLPLERLSFEGRKAPEIAPEGSRITTDSEKGRCCTCDGSCVNCPRNGKDKRN